MTAASADGSANRASGRTNQKLRTSRAIVDAARDLIGRGEVPTVAAAAELALVSPATAYRYFPDQLSLLRAAMGNDYGGPNKMEITRVPDSDDPRERIEFAARELLTEGHRHEALHRSLLSLWLMNSMKAGDEQTGSRPGLRMRWIEHALEPLTETLPAAELRRLTLALATVIGDDALFSLQDICGIPADEAIEICAWAARTLVDTVVASHHAAQ